jgi:glycosyltransferase involved in cell wall biosynthesis
VLATPASEFVGGAEHSLYLLTLALKDTGRIDPIVTVPSDGALATALTKRGIRTFVLPTPTWTPFNPRVFESVLRRSRRTLAVARRVVPWVRWLRATRPDVVVTTTGLIPTPALASAVVGIPHVWALHQFVTTDQGLRYLLSEPLSQRVIGWLSEIVVANSRAVEEHFSPPIPRRKMRMLYPGVPGFEARPNRIDLPRLRVLLLGRQTPSKGGTLALEAAGILRHEPIELEWRLVGPSDPGYRDQLAALARELDITERVQILDHTDTPGHEISWANVVLMCSDAEAFGLVTVEALKSGRPVIGTRSGGTPEIVSDGVNGLLYEPGNAEQLAAALRRLATEPGLLARMSDNAQASTRDRFTPEDYVEAFVDVLAAAARR